jgi:peptide/nickel transport system substrate-binding protein
MSRFRWLLAIVAALSVSLVLAACGGDDNGSSTTAGDADSPGALPEKQDLEGTKGGTLKVLASDDVDYIDPGQGYYQFTFMITYATQRPLYSWQPDDTTDPTPDLAADAPEISEDGKTVTVKIRPGVKYSPPVDRVVTSKDVKYAIERGFLPTVANGYAGAYFGDITGVKAFTDGKADDIAGIETPDDETVVFKLDRGTGGVVAGALSLPLSAPVPQEYAEEFDKKSPSTYGQNQVFTGPYQIKADSSGKITGYEPGKSIQLVRNPNWNGPETGDYRKAYLDAIDIDEGNSDTTVASRQILQGSGLANGDFSPPPPVLKQAVTQYQDQLALVPSGGNRYVSMNTTIAPFDNVDVRRAVFAAFDRAAMQKSRGGDIAGPVATHFIPEGMQGFDEAGGLEGPGFDFTKNPNGDLALAAEYLKKAGYEGRHVGRGRPARRGDRPGPVREARLQHQPPPGDAGLDVHEVLQRAEGEGRRLPERRLAEGLPGRADDPRPDVQREEHRPGEQLQLAAARRPGREQGDGRGGARDRSRGPREGVGRDRQADHEPRARRPVDLGPHAEHLVQGRQRRHEPVQRQRGPLVHVADVGPVTTANPVAPAS